MAITAPTLFWYQLDVGTLAPNYWGQLNTAVAQLCAVNSVTAPVAPWYSPTAGTLATAWILQVDTAVRALCVALSVTAPTGRPINLTAGTENPTYYQQLDACVRLLCAASGSGTAPTITSDGGGPTATVDVNTGDTAVTTVTATGTATISYSIVGGADAALFSIDASSGVLAFTSASVDGDYAVTVRATNLFGSATQAITAAVSSASYHADAVHFDGSTYLHLASALSGLTDSPQFLLSFWAKFGASGSANVGIAATYPNNSWNPYVDLDNDLFKMQAADYQFNDFIIPTANAAVKGQGWQNYIVSINTNFDDPDKIVQIVLNGSASLNYTPGAVPAFTIGYDDETDCYVGTSGYGDTVTCDLADLQFWVGISPTLNAGNIAKFIDGGGKPVDPAVAVAAFGSPVLLFSGDATTFATNQGTGGTFSVTGTLTNASTSPSD